MKILMSRKEFDELSPAVVNRCHVYQIEDEIILVNKKDIKFDIRLK